MRVFVFDEQKDLSFNPVKIEQLVNAVVDYEGKGYDEVSIYLATEKRISKLHKEFFDDPSPTDCISFPQEEEDFPVMYRMMGDVFVCPSIAFKYAEQHCLDPYEETSLYIVHGLLHLMGYEDLFPEKRKIMKEAEKKHMDHLRKHNALLSSIDTN